MLGRSLHRLSAQPRAAISLMTSIDKNGLFFPFKKPKTSEILPVGGTAFISIRPSGSLSLFDARIHAKMLKDQPFTRPMKASNAASCWAMILRVGSSFRASVFSSNFVCAMPTKTSGVPNTKALRNVMAMRM